MIFQITTQRDKTVSTMMNTTQATNMNVLPLLDSSFGTFTSKVNALVVNKAMNNITPIIVGISKRR